MSGTPTRKPAAPRKGAAARAEKDATQQPTIDFRGETLTLPKVLPGTIYFDIAELQDNGNDLGLHIRLLTSFIGPDQVQVVRAKIAEDETPFDEVEGTLMEIIQAAFAAYGSASGESSASPES